MAAFGGQTPTIVVLREGPYPPALCQQAYNFQFCTELQLTCFSFSACNRHGSVARKGSDLVEYQCVFSGAEYGEEHSWSVWWGFVAGGRKWEADDHERWSDCHEGMLISAEKGFGLYGVSANSHGE